MNDTPRTDAQLSLISIENEDSCCAIYVRIDGKEYDGSRRPEATDDPTNF